MATLISMPRLSPTMEEAWWPNGSKKEGDKDQSGDIAGSKTDRASMGLSARRRGYLLKIPPTPGQTVKLGAPVAVREQRRTSRRCSKEPRQAAAPVKPKPHRSSGKVA